MIERQIPEFDVLYENFRPGVMDRLGLSYERCERGAQSAHHLRVGHGIWAGRSTRRQAWSDVLIEARTGWGQLNSVDGRPVPAASAVADTLGAMNGAFGTPARSCTRSAPVRASGCGPACTGAAIAGMAEWGFHFLNAPAGEPQRPRPGHASPYTPPPYAFYATKDGYIALSSGRQIGTLSRILGIDDLSQDDRFAT